MDKLVKITIFLTAFSSSVYSTPSQLFYEKVLSGGTNIVHVDPILDIQNELNGFVYTNASTNQLIIDKFESDSVISINVPASPLKTILRYSELKDTMYLYTVSLKTWYRPQMTLTIYSNETYSQQTFKLPTNYYSGYSQLYSSDKIEHLDLRFYPNNKTPQQIIFEFCFRADDYYVTMGGESINVSTSIIYNLSLSEILFKDSKSNIHPGFLFSNENVNYIIGVKFYHYYNFTDFNNPDNYGESSYQRFSVIDELGHQNSNISTAYNNIFSVHVNNFAPSSPTDELIIHANSEDLLGSYMSKNHIACYDFSSETPSLLWYNDNVTGIDFSYIFKEKDLLVGLDTKNNVFMLNYLNGAITDSSFIESNIRNMNFFETGNNPTLLNLVGMSGDKLKSYRFDIMTYVNEQVKLEKLPNSFELFQNHPNPFNGETRLEFATTENQYLKLSIFNILGQEIKTLTANRFSPGRYSFYWNGSDENGVSQSTGVYFARLESATTSELIKLIYLK